MAIDKPKNRVVAFLGLARSGKTSGATFLKNLLVDSGYNSNIMSFAEPIKNGLDVMGVRKESHPELYRHLAQIAGHSCRSMGSQNWWIDHLKNRIDQWFDGQFKPGIRDAMPDSYVCIDDVRYPNEVQMLHKEYDALFVYVYPGERLDATSDLYKHSSETLALQAYNSIHETQDIFRRYIETIEETFPEDKNNLVAYIKNTLGMFPYTFQVKSPNIYEESSKLISGTPNLVVIDNSYSQDGYNWCLQRLSNIIRSMNEHEKNWSQSVAREWCSKEGLIVMPPPTPNPADNNTSKCEMCDREWILDSNPQDQNPYGKDDKWIWCEYCNQKIQKGMIGAPSVIYGSTHPEDIPKGEDVMMDESEKNIRGAN